jgi:hypothetical protein
VTGDNREGWAATHLATLRISGTDAPAGSLDGLLKAAGEGRATAEVSAGGHAALSGAPGDAPQRNEGR